MEAKLAEYRKRKRREEFVSAAKDTLLKMGSLGFGDKLHSTSQSQEPLLESGGGGRPWSPVSDDQMSICSDISQDMPDKDSSPWITTTLYILYFLLWLTLYIIAIRLEFGVVYLIMSALYIIWANTRTRPRKVGEVSAYSVFNPNCEAIDGTLTAQQFEQEIRFGAAAVH